ncbi:hypothetical protein [Streptomyces sp. GESEQ-4]|nr:hypothetical protein [Streptomyces sp. GESEQ-4]
MPGPGVDPAARASRRDAGEGADALSSFSVQTGGYVTQSAHGRRLRAKNT